MGGTQPQVQTRNNTMIEPLTLHMIHVTIQEPYLLTSPPLTERTLPCLHILRLVLSITLPSLLYAFHGIPIYDGGFLLSKPLAFGFFCLEGRTPHRSESEPGSGGFFESFMLLHSTSSNIHSSTPPALASSFYQLHFQHHIHIRCVRAPGFGISHGTYIHTA